MSPTPRTLQVHRQHDLRIADGQLICDKFNNDGGHFGGPFEKSAQKAHGAKLDGNTEAVMITAMFGDESTITVIKVKLSVELIGFRVIGKATIILRLPVTEKIDRHSSYCTGWGGSGGTWALRFSKRILARGRGAPLAST
jgi:hypothetical protein